MLDLQSLFDLSYGMCIISSKKDGEFNGCILNTAVQITPEPPMIAVTVNRQNLTHEYITKSKVCVISVPAEEAPLEFTGKFGFRTGRDTDKLQEVDYKLGMAGAPIILNNTAGFTEAEVTNAINVKTHTLFIGRITSCETIDDSKVPMTYAYYRNVKHGRTPKTAATYHEENQRIKEGEKTTKVQMSYVRIYL